MYLPLIVAAVVAILAFLFHLPLLWIVGWALVAFVATYFVAFGLLMFGFFVGLKSVFGGLKSVKAKSHGFRRF